MINEEYSDNEHKDNILGKRKVKKLSDEDIVKDKQRGRKRLKRVIDTSNSSRSDEKEKESSESEDEYTYDSNKGRSQSRGRRGRPPRKSAVPQGGNE